MKVIHELTLCQTCALFLANGPCEGCLHCAFGDDECGRTVALFVERWPDQRHMCLSGDVDEGGGFASAWATCDGCGGDFGNDTFAAAVLGEDDE